MGKIVQIAELSVYGDDDEVLLENLSFNLERGEIARLQGFSDLQYETLFHVLTGDISPDSGQVVLVDRNIVRLSRKNKKKMFQNEVSFLPHDFILPKKKTISQSLKFKLKITGKNLDTKERLNEVLELTGLNSKSTGLPEEMDEIERAKAGIAISIVTKPDLLVCHKPFPGLNSKGIKQVMTNLTRINEQEGSTVLLLTDEIGDGFEGVNEIETNLDSRVIS
ncbi:MAG: ATP-binding cassette domain-containing protein [Candidatus Bipolaricaulia bacterium]